MELCCFATQALEWIEKHDGLAGWLQASGGLLAIGAACAIAFVEGQRAERSLRREEARLARQEAAELEKLKTLRTSGSILVALAVHRMNAAEKGVRNSPPSQLQFVCKIHCNDLRQSETQLSNFPFWEMADPEAVNAFAQARTATSATASMLENESLRTGQRLSPSEVADILRGFIENTATMVESLKQRAKL